MKAFTTHALQQLLPKDAGPVPHCIAFVSKSAVFKELKVSVTSTLKGRLTVVVLTYLL